MHRPVCRVLAGGVLLCALAPSLAARPRVYALTGGTVHVAPGKTMERATLVLRDGLVESVGAGVKVPADATTIDATGLVIYPGFLDAGGFTPGAETPPAAPAAGGGAPAARAPRREAETGPVLPWSVVRPERRAADVLQPFEGERAREAATWRQLGFATVLAAPSKGVFRGSSALALLADETRVADLLVRDGVFQHVAFETAGFGEGYPTSLMGAAALVRQTLLDARRDADWSRRYERDPSGMPRPEVYPGLAALRPVLERKQPLLLEAGAAEDVLLADRIARELDVDLVVLATGTEAEIAPEIAKTGRTLIVPVRIPDKPKVDDPDEALDVSLEQLRRYLDAPSVPKALKAAGIPFALTTRGLKNMADFTVNVRKMLEAGLAEGDAIAALTTVPAKLLGVERSLGTLDAGKIANVLVADGPIFAKDTKLKRVFVDGTDYPIEEKAKPKGDPNAVVDPRGTWSVAIDFGGTTVQRVWTITGARGSYTGTAETRGGTVTFEKVELAGNSLTVRIPGTEGRGASEATVIITGETFEGTSEMGSRSATLTGTRTSGPGGGPGR
jgi:imidazolonepropionase-like amidohydrolase